MSMKKQIAERVDRARALCELVRLHLKRMKQRADWYDLPTTEYLERATTVLTSTIEELDRSLALLGYPGGLNDGLETRPESVGQRGAEAEGQLSGFEEPEDGPGVPQAI